MHNDHSLASPVSRSKKPRLLRTPTPQALSENTLTSDNDTAPHPPASSSILDTADSSSSASHTLEKRKYSTEASVHFHDYSSQPAVSTSSDHPNNTTSGEHAKTSNSGDTLRKILEARRRIQELLARHAREEDSAIARLTKENTVYNKTLHHIPAPSFSRGSRGSGKNTFRKVKSTTPSSSRRTSEADSKNAPSCLRQTTAPLKAKVVLPSSPCSEVPKSPDYQADDELDEFEDEDSSTTEPLPPSPPIKSKLSILDPHRRNKRARHDDEYERAKAANSLHLDATFGEPMRSPVRHQISSRPIDCAPHQTKAVRFDDSLNTVVAYRAEDPAREVSFSGESTDDSSPPGAVQAVQDVAWSSPSDSLSLASCSAPPTTSHSVPDPLSSSNSTGTISSTKRKSSADHSAETPRPFKRPSRDSLSPPQPKRHHGPAVAAPLPMLRRQSSSVSLLDTMST